MIADPDLYALFLECDKTFKYRDGLLVRRESIRGTELEYLGRLMSNRGYVHVKIFNKLYKVHRLIFLLHHGYMPKCIDHIDRDPSNNKIENLREATSAQNQQNTKVRTDNTSGVKGVFWRKSEKKWSAQCIANGKRNSLGSFSNIEDAAAAVRQFREQHHGEFANHGVQT